MGVVQRLFAVYRNADKEAVSLEKFAESIVYQCAVGLEREAKGAAFGLQILCRRNEILKEAKPCKQRFAALKHK